MKVLCAVLALSGALCVVDADSVIKTEPQVNSCQTILYDGELYVALITEPIYTLSERGELCERIKNRLYDECGLKAQVLIDAGLFFDIAHAKTLTEIDKINFIENRIKRIFLRRNYDYSGYNKTKEERTSIVL